MRSTHHPSRGSAWPELFYESWKDTLKTLHMWTQIVGKIRLVSMPWQNHSWHTTLYVTPRGLTTGAMPCRNGTFEIEFDFNRHRLILSSSFAENLTIDLYPRTVADFYRELFDRLSSLGIQVEIHGRPNEVEVSIPFAENEQDRSYDAQKVTDFWQATISTHNVFLRFRSGFIGKCSPVHFFWGAFDLAVTRFSGRPAPLHPGIAPNMPRAVMQEAYSQEVSSCGFWPGDDHFPQAAYYAYAYPAPAGFNSRPAEPESAFWSEEMGEFLLPYDAVRQAADPEQTLLRFLQSTYAAAAVTGNWERERLER